jgi:PAS domain S-box-containing protein
MMHEREREPWCVIIVDDDEDDRAHMRQLLLRGAERRYRFVEAETGGAAIAAILASPDRYPDCVLLDYYLPDLDGHDVLEAIADRDGLALCPVVVLTGSTSRDEGREVLKAGAQDFLGKESLTAESLTRAVENAIDRFALMRQLRERESTIRESETRLRLALEASNTGLWTWDLRSQAVTWSPEVYPIMGIAEGEFELTSGAFFRLVHPEDSERVQELVQAAIQRGGLYECEFRIVRPSGEVVWVENRGRARYRACGEPISMVGTVTDVSARRETDEVLRRREFELRALAENTPDIYTRFDRELRHVFVNAAVERTTGRPRESFLGKTNRELGMPSELCDHWDGALRSVFETGLPQSITFEYECADGKHHFAARLIPEITSEAGIAHVLVVTHDVTDRERYEQELRDASQRKNEFLATLAHELRNPLAPIRTSVQVLKLAANDSDVRTKALDAMERQVMHMVRLVDDLLDVSRISRGLVELLREPVELGTVIEQAVEFSRALVVAGKHELQLDLQGRPIWIDGDATRLAQVVGNLINNSAKYTPPGGRILVRVALEGADAVLSVADNGVGISANELPKIFDLFSQIEATLDRAQGGLGIGLSLVRKLVTLHGGTVTAASPGIGHGSTFTVRLPTTLAEAARLPTLAPPESVTREQTKCRRILVVDDNHDAAEMLAEMLSLSGNETEVAHDGPTAISAARAFCPHIVFLDLGLPGMDGYEVAQRLRADGALSSGVVLVALTGWGSAEDQRRTAEAGFDFHLVKPMAPGAVADIVAHSAHLAHRSSGSERGSPS